MTRTNRKRHAGEAGYLAERMNPHVHGEKVTIYIAAEQAMDSGGLKYAVVCDAHGAICGTPNITDARILMKEPEQFCEECRNLIEEGAR